MHLFSLKIVRIDLIEDCGISLSPEIDIGQVEGALVMGLGMWTTEKLQYDGTTGELLTMNTWVRPKIKAYALGIRLTFD